MGSYANLIVFNAYQIKVYKGCELPCGGLWSMINLFFVLLGSLDLGVHVGPGFSVCFCMVFVPLLPISCRKYCVGDVHMFVIIC